MHKQNHKKIPQIALTFVALTFLSGCQSMNGSTNIFDRNILVFPEQGTFEQTVETPEPTETKEELMIGAFVTEATLNQELNKIPNKDQYENVVILAPTNHKTNTDEIFTYDETTPLGFQANKEVLFKMEVANIVKSLGTITQDSWWNRQLMYDIRDAFPNAKFILLSVNTDIPHPDVTAYAFKSYLPEDSFVIAVAEEQYSENPHIKEFQQSLNHTVLNANDTSHYKDLPLSSTVTYEILGRYLQLYGSHQPKKESDAIHLVAFGDIMLGRFVRTLMDENGLDYPFQKMDDSYLRVNDLLLANLEGPITNKAIRTNTGMNFGFFPDVAPILKNHHFDLLSQANNHTLDKGDDGYNESINFIKEQGITPFGHQRDITDITAAKTIIRGQKLAFIGLEEVNSPLPDQAALDKIKSLVAEDYKVIVYPHWGIEYQNRPNQRQRDLAHAWIDAGAYAVIGHHPHVIQSYETYNGRPIFYSLGNAIFDQYWSVPTQEGLSIAMIIEDDQTIIYFLPIKLDQSQPRLMNEEETRVQLQKLVEWGDHSEAERQAILNGKLVL